LVPAINPPVAIVINIKITAIKTGGFMAGTNSGQSFNTFPLMNGKIIPDDYIIDDLGIYNVFENTVAINFNHRWLSIFVFFYILFVFFRFIKFDNKNVSNILVYLVLFFLTLQVILGIITLLSNVYLPIASLHQTNSILLLSTLLISYHQIKIRKVKNV
jgi:cytochrome c oxidase assembly protein subunit 15